MVYCVEPNKTVTYKEGVLYNENTFDCDREDGHIGHHQEVVDQRDGMFTMAAWDAGFLSVNINCAWSTKQCADCSFILPATSEPGERCKFCSFYHDLEQTKEFYVIDGIIFVVSAFKWANKRVIKVISKTGVTEITRRLVSGPTVPPELRLRFPNNAIFKPSQFTLATSVYIPYGHVYEGEDAKDIVAEYENWS